MSKRTGLGRGLGAFFGSELEAEKADGKKPAGTAVKEPEKKSLEEMDMVLPGTKKTPKKKSSSPASGKKTETKVKIVEVEKEKYVNIAKVEPNFAQPRKMFDEEQLQELADSIRNYGVLQPLLVKENGDLYEIIAGERRWRAAKLAGLREVPVIVRNYSKRETLEIALIENVQREDLNPIEEAMAYQMLIQEFGLKQEEIAERVSKNRATITNSMRLLKLDERVQQMLVEGRLSVGHARTLLGLEDGEQQYQAALKIISQKMSVREVEKMVRAMMHPRKRREPDPEEETQELFYRDLEDRMKSWMGTKVTINKKDRNKGRIEIEYYSPAELERIVDLLHSAGNREEE